MTKDIQLISELMVAGNPAMEPPTDSQIKTTTADPQQAARDFVAAVGSLEAAFAALTALKCDEADHDADDAMAIEVIAKEMEPFVYDNDALDSRLTMVS